MLTTCGFYYSPEYDVTHSRQRQSKLDFSVPIWHRIDKRFYWNADLMQPFIDHDIRDWILPAMDGYIEISPCTGILGTYYFALISRRECYRTGARFHTRGADPEGNCANFAETEQIVIFNGTVSSWVETRGSIPLIWYQPRSLTKAKPTVDFSPFSVSKQKKTKKERKKKKIIFITKTDYTNFTFFLFCKFWFIFIFI